MTLDSKKEFAGVMKVKDFKMGSLFWTIQVGPIFHKCPCRSGRGGGRRGHSVGEVTWKIDRGHHPRKVRGL